MFKPRRKITSDNIVEILNDENISPSTKYNILHRDHLKELNHQYYLKNRERIIKATTENNRINNVRHNEYNKKSKLNARNRLKLINNSNIK